MKIPDSIGDEKVLKRPLEKNKAVSYTHLTLPTIGG